MDRLTLENKKEWPMSHLLSLIMHEETTDKFGELTKREYRLEKEDGWTRRDRFKLNYVNTRMKLYYKISFRTLSMFTFVSTLLIGLTSIYYSKCPS